MTKHWLVVDNGFNRENYPKLIGRIFKNPPGYAAVRVWDAKPPTPKDRDAN